MPELGIFVKNIKIISVWAVSADEICALIVLKPLSSEMDECFGLFSEKTFRK